MTEPNNPPDPAKFKKRRFIGTAGFVFLYCVMAPGCLRRWGAPEPWSRLDIFSGEYLLLSAIGGATGLRFHRAIFRSPEVLREASGLGYDPRMLLWISALPLLAAFFLVWTDNHLVRHFSSDLESQRLMTEGPYRLICHPRYAALLVSRVAFSLALASVLGWIILVGWVVVVLRRVRREEAHLRETFGAGYDAYARRTARLVPALY